MHIVIFLDYKYTYDAEILLVLQYNENIVILLVCKAKLECFHYQTPI